MAGRAAKEKGEFVGDRAMESFARKILLPRLVVTEVVRPGDLGGTCISLESTKYYVREKSFEDEYGRLDGRPKWMGSRFNLFPVVLDAAGAPWAEATVYLLARLEGAIAPAMATYAGIADDLAAYRRFLDESKLDWTKFPSNKLSRPTYRYNGYLRISVAAGQVAATTAKRRMSTVIAFYSWLQAEGVLQPEHAPWRSSDYYLALKDSKGFQFSKQVTTTDVSIRVPRQSDPYAGSIEDGGKLRPMSVEEQEWVLSALVALGNTEMTLIHLFAFLTGARIQTILTFRVRHTMLELESPLATELRFVVGPGTGIDTKHNKRQVLHIPVWFYQMLRTYVHSDRARGRRMKAKGGDCEDQYLFLSVRGAPLYRSKVDAALFDDKNVLRHAKVGQGVRQFIVERVLPYVRAKHAPTFDYQFHDTRASFGMNMTDRQLRLVEKGHCTLHQAREFVKMRMCHESSATTDLYLQYRSDLAQVRAVGADYDSHLRRLAECAMSGKTCG